MGKININDENVKKLLINAKPSGKVLIKAKPVTFRDPNYFIFLTKDGVFTNNGKQLFDAAPSKGASNMWVDKDKNIFVATGTGIYQIDKNLQVTLLDFASWIIVSDTETYYLGVSDPEDPKEDPTMVYRLRDKRKICWLGDNNVLEPFCATDKFIFAALNPNNNGRGYMYGEIPTTGDYTNASQEIGYDLVYQLLDGSKIEANNYKGNVVTYGWTKGIFGGMDEVSAALENAGSSSTLQIFRNTGNNILEDNNANIFSIYSFLISSDKSKVLALLSADKNYLAESDVNKNTSESYYFKSIMQLPDHKILSIQPLYFEDKKELVYATNDGVYLNNYKIIDEKNVLKMVKYKLDTEGK